MSFGTTVKYGVAVAFVRGTSRTGAVRAHRTKRFAIACLAGIDSRVVESPVQAIDMRQPIEEHLPSGSGSSARSHDTDDHSAAIGHAVLVRTPPHGCVGARAPSPVEPHDSPPECEIELSIRLIDGDLRPAGGDRETLFLAVGGRNDTMTFETTRSGVSVVP